MASLSSVDQAYVNKPAVAIKEPPMRSRVVRKKYSAMFFIALMTSVFSTIAFLAIVATLMIGA